DIVFLRKRTPEKNAEHGEPDWISAEPTEIDGAKIAINRYFLKNPQMVLGTWSRKDTLYGGDSGYSIVGSGNLEEDLKAAVRQLPEYAPTAPCEKEEKQAPTFARPPPLNHITEGSFFVAADRTICQLVGDEGESVTYGGGTLRAGGTLTARRMAALVRLRDCARLVLQSQNEGWPEAERINARLDLNSAYDRFVSIHGPINKTTFSETKDGRVIRRMPNLAKFREDPDAMLV